LSIITTTSTGMKVQKEVSLLSDDDFYEGMDNINNSAQYLSQTIEDFRNFFNSKKTKLPFRLIEVIDKTLNLLHAQFNNKNIHIIKEIQDITLTNLENEFIQVLMNILNNARDELVKNSSREKYIFIHAVKKEKSVQITIKDNAGGIPPSIISRIFEPYFTTKHKRQGTGIGLYMSQEIITKNMEGAIEASNCTYEYKGTTYKGALFTIELYD
jgi:signal transduction histidine kinase